MMLSFVSMSKSSDARAFELDAKCERHGKEGRAQGAVQRPLLLSLTRFTHDKKVRDVMDVWKIKAFRDSFCKANFEQWIFPVNKWRKSFICVCICIKVKLRGIVVEVAPCTCTRSQLWIIRTL